MSPTQSIEREDDTMARSNGPTPGPVVSPAMSFAPSASVPAPTISHGADGAALDANATAVSAPTIAPTTSPDSGGGAFFEEWGDAALAFVNSRSTLELCGGGAAAVLLLCCVCGRLCQACRSCCRGDDAEAHERGRETIAANRKRHASKGGNSSRLGFSQMFDDEASQQIELGENPMRKKQQQQQQQKQRGGDRKGGGAKTREPAPARGRRDDDDEEDPAPRLSSHSRARGGSGAKKKKERREAPEPPLPEEWEEFETDEGEKYYQNHETGETQWERP